MRRTGLGAVNPAAGRQERPGRICRGRPPRSHTAAVSRGQSAGPSLAGGKWLIGTRWACIFRGRHVAVRIHHRRQPRTGARAGTWLGSCHRRRRCGWWICRRSRRRVGGIRSGGAGHSATRCGPTRGDRPAEHAAAAAHTRTGATVSCGSGADPDPNPGPGPGPDPAGRDPDDHRGSAVPRLCRDGCHRCRNRRSGRRATAAANRPRARRTRNRNCGP